MAPRGSSSDRPRRPSTSASSARGATAAEGEALELYRRKRRAGATNEPFGGDGGARPRAFVVHKHAATRLHWDLRLEWNGLLWSWAVPRGPSLDPEEKRLAVKVEEHPIDYLDFEGVIPKGNYGAGGMIVWDRGQWEPFDEPQGAFEAGMIHFELRGFKLHGIWTLVRIQKDPKNWLLIKKSDDWALPVARREAAEEPEFDERSVLSGMTVEELAAGATRAPELRAALDTLDAPKQPLRLSRFTLMLAETADAPFTDPDWLFELKYDGFRLLVVREDGADPVLRYRSGRDATSVYPDLVRAVRKLPYPRFVIDAEVVVLGEGGRPSFQALQRRVQLKRRVDVEQATVSLPATLFCFDLVSFEDYDLRGLPLVERKRLLQMMLPTLGPLRYSDHIAEQGEALFEAARGMGLEGIMAKRASAPYRSKRSADWQKILVERRGDFVIVGFTAAQGSRVGLGALHLAAYDDGTLRYAGKVGTGFGDELLQSLRVLLDGITRDTPAFEGDPEAASWRSAKTAAAANTWVEPRLVAEVRYKEMTGDELLRHPVFVRLRDDKPPVECALPVVRDRLAEASLPQETLRAETRELKLTNRKKVFWPDEGYTKGDLIDFYRAVAPHALPYLRDRPLVMTRYPDGIGGKSFYQKDVPDHIPSWIRTQVVWSEHSEREIRYVVCDDEDTLVYLANLGTIPIHVWSSRIESLQRPDWSIIDLDPKGAPFADVVRLALAVKALCDDIGLPCFAKTSGSTGLHVLLPLGGQCTYEQSRALAHLIAQVVAAERAEIATIARALDAREGKVYLDFLQNGHGRLLVAPFSVRPKAGATVSTPLTWGEVGTDLDPDRFTIRTVPDRLSRLPADPLRGVLHTRPDLLAALGALAERVDRA